MRRLILYRRPGCHLCDEVRELLRPILAEADDVELSEVDIDGDENLLRRYLERIPVLELEGRIIAELVPDPGSLRAVLLHTSAG